MTGLDNDKFITLLGFAKRAGKIVYGLDELKTVRNVKLYAVSTTASDNLSAGVRALAEQKGKPVVLVSQLEDKVGGNCKALGILDRGMADGMLEFIRSGNADYKIIT